LNCQFLQSEKALNQCSLVGTLTCYILRIDLNSEKQELFGPLFTEKDDLHWQKVAGESGMSVRSVGAQGQLLQPASCTGHGQLLNSPDTLGLVAGDLSCRDRRIDPWIKIVKERAPWVLGPNSELIDSETSDGRYYVPRLEASYYRGNPAQTASPQGGELRQYYKTFTVAGKSYDRSLFRWRGYCVWFA
jgi:hypothetical protein